MADKENPNYYAIIPANVRYDKNITANAKLLYGEITALCNEKGYCWASNDYFASLYGVSKSSISSWIAQLAKAKYINLQMIYREGSKEILNRYIRLFDDPISENLNTPIPENLKDNITSLNNTFNNIPTKEKIQKEEQFQVFYQNYPKKTDKTDARKVFNALIKSGVTLDTILSKLKVYETMIRDNKTDKKYIRGPARFLRSLDDYEIQETTRKEKTVSLCPKCGVELRNMACPQCFTNYDLEGKEL